MLLPVVWSQCLCSFLKFNFFYIKSHHNCFFPLVARAYDHLVIFGDFAWLSIVFYFFFLLLYCCRFILLGFFSMSLIATDPFTNPFVFNALIMLTYFFPSFIPADTVQEDHPETHHPQDGHWLAGATRGPEALLQIWMKSKGAAMARNITEHFITTMK